MWAVTGMALTMAEGDYGRETRGTSYYIYAPMLAIIEQ